MAISCINNLFVGWISRKLDEGPFLKIWHVSEFYTYSDYQSIIFTINEEREHSAGKIDTKFIGWSSSMLNKGAFLKPF